MPKFGSRSEENLKGVHPDLVKVHREVIKYYDHSVDDGVREYEEQLKNVAKGVSKTMDSKHLKQKDGLSHATDSRPFPAPNWNLVEKSLEAIRHIDPSLGILKFYHFQGVMKGHAKALGVNLRQGIDWDGDNDVSNQSFFDLPHNET